MLVELLVLAARAEAVHADLELLLKDVRGEQLKELDPADAARLLGVKRETLYASLALHSGLTWRGAQTVASALQVMANGVADVDSGAVTTHFPREVLAVAHSVDALRTDLAAIVKKHTITHVIVKSFHRPNQPILDPGASVWKDARPVTVAMLPQSPGVDPRSVRGPVGRGVHAVLRMLLGLVAPTAPDSETRLPRSAP